MSEKKSVVFLISYIAFFIVGVFIICVNLFLKRSEQYWMYYDFPISNVLLFVIALALGIMIWIVIRKADVYGRRLRKFFVFWMILLSIVLFIIQCKVVNDIFFYIDWDVKYLKEAAYQYLNGGMNDFYENYFRVNPNNVMMLSVTIGFLKLGNILNCNGYMMMVYTGVILNNLSVLFTALTVRKITLSDSKAIISYIMAAVFFALSPWLIAPYTDIFSLIIPVLTFYIFVSLIDKKVHWIKKVISVVVLPAIFIMLKPTNIFILLAILIYELVVLARGSDKKETIFKIIMGVIVTILIMVATKAIVYKIIDYEEDEMVQKPIAHYLLLGSNEGMVGMYSWPDDEYTNSFEGISDKTKGDIELVKKRYEEMEIAGYLKHLSRKTYLNYSNGIFGWGKEEKFVNEIEFDDDTIFRDVYYVGGDDLLIEENAFGIGGKYFSVYASFCQVVWFAVLILATFKSMENIFLELRNKRTLSFDNTKSVLAITLMGLFVFLSIFETNARYLYSMLPLYIVYINSKCYIRCR